MKKLRVLTFFLMVLIPAIGHGYVIFEENFDSITQTNCTEGVPPNWGSWSSCNSSDQRTVDGVTHYPTEFVSPGRGGTGKAFANWRNGTSWVANSSERNGYWEVLNYAAFPSNTYKELYIGFSMLVPSDMDANSGYQYVKFSWPPILSGAGPGINFYGGTHVMDQLSFLVSSVIRGDEGGGWVGLFSVIRDGQWHFYSYHMKLNTSTGSRDGIIESWVDGVATGFARYDLNYGASADSYFMGGAGNRMDIGFGNCGDTLTTWQNGWRALLIDDYIVSTTYIEPPGNLLIDHPPSPPSGLRIIQ